MWDIEDSIVVRVKDNAKWAGTTVSAGEVPECITHSSARLEYKNGRRVVRHRALYARKWVREGATNTQRTAKYMPRDRDIILKYTELICIKVYHGGMNKKHTAWPRYSRSPFCWWLWRSLWRWHHQWLPLHLGMQGRSRVGRWNRSRGRAGEKRDK